MIQSSKLIFNNLKKYSFLLKQLINRDFKVKYKRSVLGIVWSLLYPILMMTVMSIVFSNMFRFAVEGVNYLVYLMIGIVVWNYFTDATGVSLGSIIDNFSLISKVYIPKYIFPLSKVLFSTINFLLTLIPLMGIIILSKVGLGKYPVYIGINYIYIIYIFICLFMFILGMSFIFSAFSVFFRDLIYIYGILILIWNYLTPVFYSIEIIPQQLRFFFNLNPMYQFLNSFRKIILYGQGLDFKHSLILFLIGFVTLAVGSFVFKKNQDKFIYYI